MPEMEIPKLSVTKVNAADRRSPSMFLKFSSLLPFILGQYHQSSGKNSEHKKAPIVNIRP